MHVAFYTNSYYPVTSGVVRSVSEFRKALNKLGHNVFIFAQDAGDYEDQEPFIFRYPALDLGFPGDAPAAIPISSFIDKLFPSLKVDVVHSQHPVLLGQTAANKAEKYNLPLVFTFHSRYREYSQYLPLSQDFVQGLVKDMIDYWVVNYIQRCQHIVVPSESIQDILLNEYGVRDRITVIPTGLELELYQHADGSIIRKRHGWADQKIMISVGRLAKEKNWLTLISASKQVLQRHPDTRLVIVGSGDDRHDLEKHAQQLGIEQQVDFIGAVPFDEIPSYLKAADLFCFAAVNETQGLVTLEAMAAGLPVVAVDATGTRDILQNDCEGVLTENDSYALGQAIGQLLEDPQRLARYREAAEAKARQFSIEEEAKKLIEVYHEAQDARRANLFVPVEREEV